MSNGKYGALDRASAESLLAGGRGTSPREARLAVDPHPPQRAHVLAPPSLGSPHRALMCSHLPRRRG
jgi:hypothetical protein